MNHLNPQITELQTLLCKIDTSLQLKKLNKQEKRIQKAVQSLWLVTNPNLQQRLIKTPFQNFD